MIGPFPLPEEIRRMHRPPESNPPSMEPIWQSHGEWMEEMSRLEEDRDRYGTDYDAAFSLKPVARSGASESWRRTDKDYMPVYQLDMEPEETADGDEADIYGSISSDTIMIWKQDGAGSGGRTWNAAKESRINPKTGRYNTFWRFTHSEIPDRPEIRTILLNRYWVACTRLDAGLSGKEAMQAAKRCSVKESCERCQFRMDLSFKERERGRLFGEKREGITKVDENFIVVEPAGGISQIDRRFSWPYQCLETFRALKPVHDNSDLLAPDTVLVKKHKFLNKIFQNDIHYEPPPTDLKTIKKRRAAGRRSIPAYGHGVYKDLPIGKLLKDTKGAGYSAVWCVAGFGALAPIWEVEPTRSNLIEWFQDQDLLDHDVARKYYDLLIECGVIHQLKRFQRGSLLYLRNSTEYYKSEKL